MLSELLKTVAPTLARALGGPLGGVVVDMIAKQFNTKNNVSSIEAYIRNDPAAAQQYLKTLEAEFQSEIARINGQAENMRLYYDTTKSDVNRSWFWSWARPSAAWFLLIFTSAVSVVIVRNLWSGDYEIMRHIDMLVLWMSIPAALAGIWFWGRTVEKISTKSQVSATEQGQ